MSDSKYKVIGLCGRAGSGKDTIAEYLAKDYGYKKIVNYTTRPKRENETEGIQYHFVDEETFLQLPIIDTSCFNNWYYGISLDELSTLTPNIVVGDSQRLMQLLLQKDIELYPFEICANDKTLLKRALFREEKPDCAEICRRFLSDLDQYVHTNHPFSRVYNEDTSTPQETATKIKNKFEHKVKYNQFLSLKNYVMIDKK